MQVSLLKTSVCHLGGGLDVFTTAMYEKRLTEAEQGSIYAFTWRLSWQSTILHCQSMSEFEVSTFTK